MSLGGAFALPPGRKRKLARLMELGLVAILLVGVWDRETGVIVNATVALAVTQLPPLLERDLDLTMDPLLVLWLTSAVFLHALGTVDVPGTRSNVYQTLWWWDHLTHALSASVVAAAGYAAVRALDLHSEEISFPPRFVAVFVLLFVLAFGVFWEVLEFALGGLAPLLGGSSVLTQYGLEDTMLDLVFDLVGALVVAGGASAYLGGLVGALARHLDQRST